MMHLTGPAACLATLLATTVVASRGVGDDESQFLDDQVVNFNFGDSCEKLEDLSFDAVMQLTIAADDHMRASFCTVADPYDCRDLTAALSEFGRLVPAKTKGFCRFVPRAVHREPRITVWS